MFFLTKKKRKAIACAMLYAYSLQLTQKKKKRSAWSKKWLEERATYGHIPLVMELRGNNPCDFRNYLRMDCATFDNLLKLLAPHLTKQDTVMRNAIPADERLMATLRFLATGRSYEDLKFSTAISPQALGYIIPETCKIIFKILQPDYLKVIFLLNIFIIFLLS